VLVAVAVGGGGGFGGLVEVGWLVFMKGDGIHKVFGFIRRGVGIHKSLVSFGGGTSFKGQG